MARREWWRVVRAASALVTTLLVSAACEEAAGRASDYHVPGGNADQAYDADDKNPTPLYAAGGG